MVDWVCPAQIPRLNIYIYIYKTAERVTYRVVPGVTLHFEDGLHLYATAINGRHRALANRGALIHSEVCQR